MGQEPSGALAAGPPSHAPTREGGAQIGLGQGSGALGQQRQGHNGPQPEADSS